MIEWIILGVYLFGYSISYVLAQRHWLREFPEDKNSEKFMDWLAVLLWPAFAAIIWPIWIPFAIIWRLKT